MKLFIITKQWLYMSNDYKYVKKYYRKFIAIYSHVIYCALLLIIKEVGEHIYLYLCIYIYIYTHTHTCIYIKKKYGIS